MDYHRTKVGWVQFPGPAIHFGIAETVEGKTGAPRFLRPPRAEYSGRGFGIPQGTGAKFAIFQHFCVPQSDGLPGRPLHRKAQPAHQILAEIQQSPAGWRAGDGNGRHSFEPANWRPDRGNQVIRSHARLRTVFQ